MAFPIYGVTLVIQPPWNDVQTAAIRRACREVLLREHPGRAEPTEQELDAFWQSHLEPENSAVVYGTRCTHTAYWQTWDGDEAARLYDAFEKHCTPYRMRVTSHFSV